MKCTVCEVSFVDPSTKNKYIWRTSEIMDDLNPVWNETMSWPLLFNPPDNMPITFEIWDIDSFTSRDEVGKVTVELGKIGMNFVRNFRVTDAIKTIDCIFYILYRSRK